MLLERVTAYNAALPTPAPTSAAQPFVQGAGLDKLPPTRILRTSGVLQDVAFHLTILPERAVEVYALYDALDADGNGLLTAGEMQNQKLADFIGEMDKDTNGAVDKDEFLTFFVKEAMGCG